MNETISAAIAAGAGAFTLVVCLWLGIRAWVAYDAK